MLIGSHHLSKKLKIASPKMMQKSVNQLYYLNFFLKWVGTNQQNLFFGWFIFLSAQFQKLLKSPICCGFKHVDGIECYPILNGMGRIKDVKARLNSDISLSFIDKINNQKLLEFFLTALWKYPQFPMSLQVVWTWDGELAGTKVLTILLLTFTKFSVAIAT